LLTSPVPLGFASLWASGLSVLRQPVKEWYARLKFCLPSWGCNDRHVWGAGFNGLFDESPATETAGRHNTAVPTRRSRIFLISRTLLGSVPCRERHNPGGRIILKCANLGVEEMPSRHLL
jgi:hypothetical protein